MEVSDVRRRLRHAIDRARQASIDRRARHDEGARAYDVFLQKIAIPVFRLVCTSLKAEGFPFSVSTPAGAVRLASASSANDYVELSLDSNGDDPQVIGRSSRGRGRRLVRSERPIREGRAITLLTDEDVLEYVMEEIVPLVQR